MALALALPLAGRGAPDALGGQTVGWGGYNNDLQGRRFSSLAQINTANVARLQPVCELNMGEEGPFQTGPVVVGRTMFLTTPHTTVAMDAVTCAVLWRDVDSNGLQEPMNVNRGVAFADGTLFRGMAGARLAAIDAATGKVLWDRKVGDSHINESVSSAPVVWNGLVIVGLSGGDFMIHGRVMAFDAATGRQVWTFNTIPADGEVGAETWPKGQPRGGGGVWTTYTIDPKTGELFVSVANPSPDLTPELRPGDNLFADSMVVLDAATGKLKWWRQVRNFDAYDWDLGAAPALYSVNAKSLAVVGSKDGHLYGIDRASHQIVFKTAITTIHDPGHAPTPQGTFACPGVVGGVEWNGPAVDPSGVIYVGAVDWCATYIQGQASAKMGAMDDFGTGYKGDPIEKASGWITAVDGASGKIVWQFHAPKPVVSGITPTAGGLLFAGDMGGNFYAFDRKTGRLLMQRNLGGPVAGGVVTYRVDGRQYVATTAGNLSRALWGTMGAPKTIVMAVDAGPEPAPKSLPQIDAFGPVVPGASGAPRTFGQYCAVCHGPAGEGVSGPNLVRSQIRDRDALIAFIKNPKGAMPKMYPAYLDDAQVSDAADYVLTLQRQGAAAK